MPTNKRKLKVLHVTEDHSANNSGITSAVQYLTQKLAPNVDQTIISVGPNAVEVKPPIKLILINANGLTRIWKWAAGGQHIIRDLILTTDILHLHGLWMWPQWIASRFAISIQKPAILSPHGMLEPYIWSSRPWYNQVKKSIYWQLIAYPVFRNCEKIHAVTERESKTLASYFPNQEIRVIPHALDTRDIGFDSSLSDPNWRDPYVLFLGRLHPVKGIDLLIQAFAGIITSDFGAKNNFNLIIAGPVEEKVSNYKNILTNLVAELKIGYQVKFIGPVQGSDKWELIKNAWVICAPSHSEVIGLVNLEAAFCATPVLASTRSGLPEAWNDHGGILVDPNVKDISDKLQEVMKWSSKIRNERGEKLKAFAIENFSWQVIEQNWLSLYDSINIR